MKRALTVAVFVMIGLSSTWAGLWIATRLDFTPALGDAARIIPRCWERDECQSVPWWGIALFVTGLLIPTLVHAAAGYRLAPAIEHRIVVAAVVAAALLVMTALYFVSANFIVHALA